MIGGVGFSIISSTLFGIEDPSQMFVETGKGKTDVSRIVIIVCDGFIKCN